MVINLQAGYLHVVVVLVVPDLDLVVVVVVLEGQEEEGQEEEGQEEEEEDLLVSKGVLLDVKRDKQTVFM